MKFALLCIVRFSARLRYIGKYRRAANMIGGYPFFKLYRKDVDYLCPSLPEIDFPMTTPPNIALCGPILLPALSAPTPELDKWLQRGPTVLINLGTLLKIDTGYIQQMAAGIRIALVRYPDIQVLWKIPLSSRDPATNSAIDRELSVGLFADRVRIEQWFAAEPSSILRSETVFCSVNHGGANIYYESIW
jgi:hypothetical protein